MNEHQSRASRRRVLLASAGGIASGVLTPRAAAQTPDAETPGVMVDAPAWTFGVHELHDPYDGAMQVPAETPAGQRVVAVEVEVANESDQALAFTPLDVRLRDAAGTEYRGGAAIGAEPMISPRNLNPGERSRGWVWYLVGEQAQLTEVVYTGPSPQFRVPLPL